jgi:hypothetical protein
MSSEAPKRWGRGRVLARLERAADDAERQIVAYKAGVESFPSEPQREAVIVAERPHVRKGDRAKREAAVINAGLASTPEAKKGSLEYWVGLFGRKWDKVKRFLKTASHKGRFNPEIIAEVLDAKAAERKAVKTSIFKRAR